MLFSVFTAALFVSYSRGVRGACNCLGELLPASMGPLAIGRALALAASSVGLLAIGPTDYPALVWSRPQVRSRRCWRWVDSRAAR